MAGHPRNFEAGGFSSGEIFRHLGKSAGSVVSVTDQRPDRRPFFPAGTGEGDQCIATFSPVTVPFFTWQNG